MDKGPKVVGITGAYASGKSTVAALFEEKGAFRIDADEIARVLLSEDQDIRARVKFYFGEKILSSGEIDREKLAREIFSDREKNKRLCRLMHPAVIRIIKDRISKSPSGIVVVDAPLLIEAGAHKFVDVIVVVDAAFDVRLERAAGRGMTEEEVRLIDANQLSFEEKAENADFIIDNNGDIDKTKEGVEKVWADL